MKPKETPTKQNKKPLSRCVCFQGHLLIWDTSCKGKCTQQSAGKQHGGVYMFRINGHSWHISDTSQVRTSKQLDCSAWILDYLDQNSDNLWASSSNLTSVSWQVEEDKNTWKSDHENEVNLEHLCSYREDRVFRTWPVLADSCVRAPPAYKAPYLVLTATLKGGGTNSADKLGNWGLKRSWVSPEVPRGTSDDLAYTRWCVILEDEQMHARERLNVIAWKPRNSGVVALMLGSNKVRVTGCFGKQWTGVFCFSFSLFMCGICQHISAYVYSVGTWTCITCT